MPYFGNVHYLEVSFRGLCELGPKSGVSYREVSAIKSPLRRGFVMSVISSIPEKSVC